MTNAPSGSGFVQISAGYAHGVALHGNGQITSWGFDDWNQVGGTPAGSDFSQVSAGQFHNLALRTDGSIAAWGHDGGSGVGAVSGTPSGTGFIYVAAGSATSFALRPDGSIAAWGSNAFGLSSNAPTGAGFTQIVAGSQHALALRADGTVAAWGNGWDAHYGRPTGLLSDAPKGAGYTELASGGMHAGAIRTSGMGNALCFGDGTASPCPCISFGDPGEGCANSTGNGGARLTGYGTASIANDTFGLGVARLPAFKPGLLLRGSNAANSSQGLPAGDGLLCVTGLSARSQIKFTADGGEVTFENFQSSNFGSWSYGPGVPVYYQYWYRDGDNTCSGSGFNFSNAWTVTWLP